MAVIVVGAEQFRDLGRRLKDQGTTGKGLRRELFRAIDDATLLLKEELVASALDTLPGRGGLNKVVAASRIATTKRLAGSDSTVGVTVKTTNPHAIGSMDRGTVRHPLFGNKARWFTQAVKPGWWTRPTQARKEPVGKDIAAAMETTKQKIEKG